MTVAFLIPNKNMLKMAKYFKMLESLAVRDRMNIKTLK